MRILLIWALAVLCSCTAFSQTSSKAAKIRKYMEVTGSSKLISGTIDNYIEITKRSYPDVDPAYWSELKTELPADELLNLIVPIYDKHLSEAELDALIAFYTSPVGKKVLESLPVIMKESMEAGTEWGRIAGQRIVEKMKAKGYMQ